MEEKKIIIEIKPMGVSVSVRNLSDVEVLGLSQYLQIYANKQIIGMSKYPKANSLEKVNDFVPSQNTNAVPYGLPVEEHRFKEQVKLFVCGMEIVIEPKSYLASVEILDERNVDVVKTGQGGHQYKTKMDTVAIFNKTPIEFKEEFEGLCYREAIKKQQEETEISVFGQLIRIQPLSNIVCVEIFDKDTVLIIRKEQSGMYYQNPINTTEFRITPQEFKDEFYKQCAIKWQKGLKPNTDVEFTDV